MTAQFRKGRFRRGQFRRERFEIVEARFGGSRANLEAGDFGRWARETLGRAPLVAPSLCFVGGVWFSNRLEELPIGLLSICVALGVAWRQRTGLLLAASALGMLHGALLWTLPQRQLDGFDSRRAVAVVVSSRGSWQREEWGWEASVLCRRVRQGRRVVTVPLLARASLGSDADPPRGRRWRARGYLSRLPPPANDQPKGPERFRLVIKSHRLVDPIDPRPTLSLRIRWWVRHRLGLEAEPSARAQEPPLRSPGIAMVEALLFGDASHLAEELHASLYRLGLGHVLAVSGLHVGLLLVPLVKLLGGARPSIKIFLVTLVLLLYTCLAGGRPALIRAGIVVLALVLAGAVARPASTLNALAGVLAMLVGVAPWSVHELGLQLTFAASAGIVLLSEPFERLLERWYRRALLRPPGGLGRWALMGVAVSLAAQLATLPIVLWRFSWLAAGASLLNLGFVPLTALMLALALGTSATALLLGCGLEPFAPVLDGVAQPFSWGARLPAAPWWGVPLDPRDPVIWLGVAVGWAALVRSGPKPRWVRVGVPIALVAVVCLLLSSGSRPSRGAELVMLDVGQGDAFLLRDTRTTVLIDGGGWRNGDLARAVLIPALARLGVRRLDLLVVSHGDTDHCRGAAQLRNYIPVERVWIGEGERESSCGRAMRLRAVERLEVVSRGQPVQIGAIGLEVLAPEPGAGRAGNDGSLVLAASVGGRRLLFTGDITAKVERELVGQQTDLRFDLLKVAHHGSKTSTTASWLAAVSPGVALISVGARNRYGHPTSEILRRLAQRGIVVLRTDRHGRVRIGLERGSPLRISVVGRLREETGA